MAVPVRGDLLAQVRELGLRSGRCARRYHERASERVTALLRHWPEPAMLLAPQRQRTDELGERLPRALSRRLAIASAELHRKTGALRPRLLVDRLDRDRARLDRLVREAALLHPERPLAKGYALVESRDGKVIMSVAAAKASAALRLRFADGAVDARVEREAGAKYNAHKPEQPTLL
jgi:exodeoxyribonuclease VII large subunit